MLKEYSDGKNIEIEIMYGTTEKINISSKLFFCSNPTPNFKTDDNSNDEDKQKVRDILYKICNCNEEHLEYYLSILGFSMIKDPEKKKSMYF